MKPAFLFRSNFWFTLAGILIVLAIGTRQFARSSPAVERLTLVLPPQTEPVQVGTSKTLAAFIQNDSDRAVTILGSPPLCILEGCIWVTNLPVTIPARSTGTLDLLVKAGRPGPFDVSTTLYTTASFQPRLTLRYQALFEGETLPPPPTLSVSVSIVP